MNLVVFLSTEGAIKQLMLCLEGRLKRRLFLCPFKSSPDFESGDDLKLATKIISCVVQFVLISYRIQINSNQNEKNSNYFTGSFPAFQLY